MSPKQLADRVADAVAERLAGLTGVVSRRVAAAVVRQRRF